MQAVKPQRQPQYGFKDTSHYNGYEQDCTDELQSGSRRYRQRQIVREIDALGGYMGIVTDRTAIQFRMLNQSKGPAMWSPRSQSDRARFIECWRGILENLPNLYIWQDTVRELLLDGNTVCGVKTYMGVEFHAKSVVLTNGTFLNGLMHIGRTQIRGGRIAEPAATGLTEQLVSLGIKSERMKTGTPVRIDARSVHFDEMAEQRTEKRLP